MQILRSTYFMIRRMLRGYFFFVILLIIPIVLITVIGLVAGEELDPLLGIPMVYSVSIVLIFAFQLFGGYYTMEYINTDFFSSRKWRILALPYHIFHHAFAILLSSILFSVLQGLLLVFYTQWVYNVQWGNIALVILVLFALSTLSQLVFLNIRLGVKNSKTVEHLGTVYGLLSLALAGVWFSMPEEGFLGFLSTYGNPLSLGENAIYAFMGYGDMSRAVISLSIIFGSSILLIVLALFLGRRKLA